MNRTLRVLALAGGLSVSMLTAGPATQALAAGPAMYQNCTNLQKTYAHGIGRANASDKVSGTSKPVTTWKRDTAGYNKAMSYNRGLDRDKDGVACEKR